VPNSFFLQNHVINYTPSDDIIRTQVTVGVVYGSSSGPPHASRHRRAPGGQ